MEGYHGIASGYGFMALEDLGSRFGVFGVEWNGMEMLGWVGKF